MFDTNDVFENAVKESVLHTDENTKKGMGSKVVSLVLLGSLAYVGFNVYNERLSLDKALVVKNQLISDIQVESENIAALVEPVEVASIDSSEEAYLQALKEIESELVNDQVNVNLDTDEQMDLSMAMNNLLEDVSLADNSQYTKELKKEIGIEDEAQMVDASLLNETQDKRVIVVKKGDTLQGISNKFYGDAMNYKRIIASNDGLINNDTIYVGQTILLPY